MLIPERGRNGVFPKSHSSLRPMTRMMLWGGCPRRLASRKSKVLIEGAPPKTPMRMILFGKNPWLPGMHLHGKRSRYLEDQAIRKAHPLPLPLGNQHRPPANRGLPRLHSRKQGPDDDPPEYAPKLGDPELSTETKEIIPEREPSNQGGQHSESLAGKVDASQKSLLYDSSLTATFQLGDLDELAVPLGADFWTNMQEGLHVLRSKHFDREGKLAQWAKQLKVKESALNTVIAQAQEHHSEMESSLDFREHSLKEAQVTLENNGGKI